MRYKICDNCKGIVNYDPYFCAEICSKCGRMERKKEEETMDPRVDKSQTERSPKENLGLYIIE